MVCVCGGGGRGVLQVMGRVTGEWVKEAIEADCHLCQACE